MRRDRIVSTGVARIVARTDVRLASAAQGVSPNKKPSCVRATLIVMIPRAASRSSKSRRLKGNRKQDQTAYATISGEKRWPLKAPEWLAFVMSAGTISDQAPQVDDAVPT